MQAITNGGFGVLLWYLITKHIPAIESRHKEERTELHQYIERRDNEFREYLVTRDDAQAKRDEQIMACIDKFQGTMAHFEKTLEKNHGTE